MTYSHFKVCFSAVCSTTQPFCIHTINVVVTIVCQNWKSDLVGWKLFLGLTRNCSPSIHAISNTAFSCAFHSAVYMKKKKEFSLKCDMREIRSKFRFQPPYLPLSEGAVLEIIHTTPMEGFCFAPPPPDNFQFSLICCF